ncbi:nicotinate-nucleotide adenylyltransferase [Craterilacuibacter sp.]|uniref:nicotinate-nucleotide adenylyltransferase n=1 Tax=Craterilacuibacter sp. TaxID=2870909 RepID=UPI003F36CFA7
MKRIGLYGGTFDPIHCAHLRLAAALRDELQLDEVRLVPAGQPYHRDHGPHASARQRLDMVRLAIKGEPGLIADDREVRRQKNAYTVDTLQELRTELGPDAELWCLIGGDSLARLPSWHHWQDIFTLANLAVALRPGFDPAHLEPAIRAEWQTRQVFDFSNRTPSGTIRALTLAPVDVSATRIRARLAAGEDAGGLVPAAVLDYIRQQQLYRNTLA